MALPRALHQILRTLVHTAFPKATLAVATATQVGASIACALQT